MYKEKQEGRIDDGNKNNKENKIERQAYLFKQIKLIV